MGDATWGSVLACGVALGAIAYASYRPRRKHGGEWNTEPYDLIIDIRGSPAKDPWSIEVYNPYPKDVDALSICVLGDFKVGKTFLINHLCLLNLTSIESHHTRGLSFKRPPHPRDQFVLIDTAGHGSPYDIRTETGEERTACENLINELAYRLSDVRIVVVSNCKLTDQEFILSLHHQISQDSTPGKDVLIVVHNYYRVTNPDLLSQAFQNDVVSRFGLEQLRMPFRGTESPKSVWVDRSGVHPVHHVFLGKEGSAAGNRFNEPTFNAIFDMCVDRLSYPKKHNFLEDTINLCNSGLVQQHLRVSQPVELSASGDKIQIGEGFVGSSYSGGTTTPPPDLSASYNSDGLNGLTLSDYVRSQPQYSYPEAPISNDLAFQQGVQF